MDLEKNKILFSATEELTAGTPETTASSDFIELSEEGASVNGPREVKDINPLSGDRLKTKSRRTIQNGDGSGNAFLRAGENQGDKSELDIILKSFGFSLEQVTTTTLTTTGNTSTVLQVTPGDETKYKVGQMVLVNNKHISPISVLASGKITLLIANPDGAFAGGVVISKVANYRLDDQTDKTFTARKWFSGEVKQEIPYCKTKSISISNLVTGEVPKVGFAFNGINFSEVLETLGITPNFVDSEYPFAIDACLYKDTTKLEANEVSFNMEQNLAMKKTLCAENGNKSVRATGKYNISGSMTVYKNDTEIELPINDEVFSLFVSLYVPSSVAGEKVNCVSIYFPRVKVTERDTNGDIEGLVSSNVSFKAEPTSDSSSYPVISFI